MIRTVIFDLGGTLIEYASEHDTWPELEEPGLNAAYTVLSESGIEMPDRQKFRSAGYGILPDRWNEATGSERNLTTADFLIEILKALDIDQPGAQTLASAVDSYEAAVCAGATMVPHAFEVVQQLSKAGYRLGLISNTMYQGKSHLADLERFGLYGFFESYMFSADVNKWKPNRAAFTHVMAALRAAPETTVFIGDDPNADVTGAKRAGIRAVHFHSSDRFAAPTLDLPDATIDDLRQLQSVLLHINGGRTN
jgi:putative hydrolase of the HAD superfamily